MESGYNLSLGEFAKNGTLDYRQTVVNPFTYTQFVVTEEPFEDKDPNAAAKHLGEQSYKHHLNNNPRVFFLDFFISYFIIQFHWDLE